MTRAPRSFPGQPGSTGSDEVEFLAPRSDLFSGGEHGEGADEGFRVIGSDEPVTLAFADVDEAPRTRTSTVLAGLGLAGLIAVGIVAAAPWSSDEQAIPPTTLERPATTVAPSTTDDTPAVTMQLFPFEDDEDLSPHGPGFVILRPPTGMTAVGAYDQAGQLGAAHLEIWASSPDADRTTGSWMAIATTEYADGRSELAADASVVDIGGVAGLVVRDRDDVTVLTWRPGDTTRISIASHGIGLSQLLAIAGGIHMADGRATYATLPATDDGTSLFRLVDIATVSGDLSAQAAQLAERIAVYEDRSGTTSLVVGTRAVRDTDALIARFLLATATTSDGTEVRRHLTVNGLDVAVGSLPLSPRANVVQWQDGDEWITVIGTVPLDRLIRSLRTGRMANEDEWDALVEQALAPEGSTDNGPAFATIGAGTVAGHGWGAAVSEEAGYLVIRSEEFYYSENVDPATDPPIRTYRSVTGTYVVALVEGPTPGTLVVTPAGADPIVVPLVTVGDGSWAGAVAAFDGTGEFTAGIAPDNSPIVAPDEAPDLTTDA